MDSDTFSFALKMGKKCIGVRLLDITDAYTHASLRPANYDEVVLMVKMLTQELSDYVGSALVSPA